MPCVATLAVVPEAFVWFIYLIPPALRARRIHGDWRPKFLKASLNQYEVHTSPTLMTTRCFDRRSKLALRFLVRASLSCRVLYQVGNIKFFSATYRLFKLAELEQDCEDYGEAVIYKGTVPSSPNSFSLDNHHVMDAGRVFPVCRNTLHMLTGTRFARHFEKVRGLVHVFVKGGVFGDMFPTNHSIWLYGTKLHEDEGSVQLFWRRIQHYVWDDFNLMIHVALFVFSCHVYFFAQTWFRSTTQVGDGKTHYGIYPDCGKSTPFASADSSASTASRATPAVSKSASKSASKGGGCC